jgi:hypothetical protein
MAEYNILTHDPGHYARTDFIDGPRIILYREFVYRILLGTPTHRGSWGPESHGLRLQGPFEPARDGELLQARVVADGDCAAGTVGFGC